MIEEEEPPAPPNILWLLSYADLMTLLFAAFVILYGITPQGKELAPAAAISSIREAFQPYPDDIPPDILRDGPIVQGFEVFKHFKGKSLTPPTIKKYDRKTKALNVINKDIHDAETLLTLRSKQGRESIVPKKENQDVTIVREKNGFKLRLLASQFYEPGEFRIKRELYQRVALVGNFLKSLNRSITIEGYTDNVPPTSEMSNLQLSGLRASYLAKHFIETLQLPEELINIAGYGEYRTIADNSTEEGRTLNRRIEIKVHYNDLEQ